MLPFVQILWVNSQGLFVLGLGLWVFALIAATARPKRDSDKTNLFVEAHRIDCRRLRPVWQCFINPYGIKGAVYPLQLMGTMGNPIFRDSIAELKPMEKFIKESGWTHRVLLTQLVTLAARGF